MPLAGRRPSSGTSTTISSPSPAPAIWSSARRNDAAVSPVSITPESGRTSTSWPPPSTAMAILRRTNTPASGPSSSGWSVSARERSFDRRYNVVSSPSAARGRRGLPTLCYLRLPSSSMAFGVAQLLAIVDDAAPGGARPGRRRGRGRRAGTGHPSAGGVRGGSPVSPIARSATCARRWPSTPSLVSWRRRSTSRSAARVAISLAWEVAHVGDIGAAVCAPGRDRGRRRRPGSRRPPQPTRRAPVPDRPSRRGRARLDDGTRRGSRRW